MTPFRDDESWKTQRPTSYQKALLFRQTVYATGLTIFGEDQKSLSLVNWMNGPRLVIESLLDADEENWFSENTPIPFSRRTQLATMNTLVSSQEASKDSDLFLFKKL